MKHDMDLSQVKALLPEKIRRIDWQSPIGKGGQKQVYMAEVKGFDHPLVLKVIYPSPESLSWILLPD